MALSATIFCHLAGLTRARWPRRRSLLSCCCCRAPPGLCSRPYWSGSSLAWAAVPPGPRANPRGPPLRRPPRWRSVRVRPRRRPRPRHRAQTRGPGGAAGARGNLAALGRAGDRAARGLAPSPRPPATGALGARGLRGARRDRLRGPPRRRRSRARRAALGGAEAPSRPARRGPGLGDPRSRPPTSHQRPRPQCGCAPGRSTTRCSPPPQRPRWRCCDAGRRRYSVGFSGAD